MNNFFQFKIDQTENDIQSAKVIERIRSLSGFKTFRSCFAKPISLSHLQANQQNVKILKSARDLLVVSVTVPVLGVS